MTRRVLKVLRTCALNVDNVVVRPAPPATNPELVANLWKLGSLLESYSSTVGATVVKMFGVHMSWPAEVAKYCMLVATVDVPYEFL